MTKKSRKKSTYRKCRVCLDWFRREQVNTGGVCRGCERDWLARSGQ